MANVGLRDLLEAGVHFGHQTRKWNPKMKPYIFIARGGIYIIDLQRTLKNLNQATEFLKVIGSKGGTVLFVGTKKQAKVAIREMAEKAGVAKGTLYRYFESKADLYVAVLADNGNAFTDDREADV